MFSRITILRVRPTKMCQNAHFANLLGNCFHSAAKIKSSACSVGLWCKQSRSVKQQLWHIRPLTSCVIGGNGEWQQPSGFDTGIVLWHPVAKKKVPLILTQKKIIKWYMCGPTVYDSAHIGHASSYVRFDIIRRILSTVFDMDIMLVMGLTDIDDKIIKRTIETGVSLIQLTKKYEAEFFQDMGSLNIQRPSALTRVTDHIDIIIHFVQGIINNGLAYVTEDGSVYFDVQKYGKYGHLHQVVYDSDTKSDRSKKNPPDFALWKSSKPDEPVWQSPWGKGRPGWHIECSAMASSVFGSNMDLHSGGEDLMFPHHENEIAQSQGYFGCSQWSNYWLHTGHLHLRGDREKMSKSLKNVISVSEMLENYTPNQFRMLCLLRHYRNAIEFSPESMEDAVAMMMQLSSLITQCDAYVSGQFDCPGITESDLLAKIYTTREAVKTAFADDFNTPKAMEELTGLMKYVNQQMAHRVWTKVPSISRSPSAVGTVTAYINRLLTQLGINLNKQKAEEVTGVQQHLLMNTVIDFRSVVRSTSLDYDRVAQVLDKYTTETIPENKKKQMSKEIFGPLLMACDDFREQCISAGVRIQDLKNKSTWSMEERSSKKNEDMAKSTESSL